MKPHLDIATVRSAHAHSVDNLLETLNSTRLGLSQAEAEVRLAAFGPNVLPTAQQSTLLLLFLQQFKGPLIYVLLAAAMISAFLREWSDAGFICAVLLLNAAIGTFQEYAAERSAQALRGLISSRTRVLRDGDLREIDAAAVVPGDVVLLEPGGKVPADLRLLETHNLHTDESLLTGESLNTEKSAKSPIAIESALGDRMNMAFAGTLVTTGRAYGLVVATALNTELGQIAQLVSERQGVKPPLLLRMARFTQMIAMAVGLSVIGLALIELVRGASPADIFLLAVALAVSAIPEGLPVALTVALSIGMRRMASRNVIVRRLVAIEALGSCTYIATDKTGTLTVNQLTVRRVQLPGQQVWEITGEGLSTEGTWLLPEGIDLVEHAGRLSRIGQAAVLANEASLWRIDDKWSGSGDAVDLALLIFAHKIGITQAEAREFFPEIETIPYESAARFSASLNQHPDGIFASAKGAVETILPMCTHMATLQGDVPINQGEIWSQAEKIAAAGYRVLALTGGRLPPTGESCFTNRSPKGLTLLGLVGLSDPPRPEVRNAIACCLHAGIQVAMITGDHPATALAVAREVGLAESADQVITGTQLVAAELQDLDTFDTLCRQGRVFARIEPLQKLAIVESLQRQGHYVAVTGDGVNDAPALRVAQVGVAMGLSGTDVARETAALIITDDNFASIVAGIEEGRIAYGNVRKVIFLLISTGAAEIVLFALALLAGAPLPLLAVQLLWLNLVTNGIQDVALAFEPAEGDELRKPPRQPNERIFNRLMIERVLLSALVIGSLAFTAYQWMLFRGFSVDESRNATLLLMVLFENVQAFNSRSETLSVFRHNPLRNKALLFGTVAAQLVHIGAMYTPGLRDILGIQPISSGLWLELLAISMSILVAMEAHKLIARHRSPVIS